MSRHRKEDDEPAIDLRKSPEPNAGGDGPSAPPALDLTKSGSGQPVPEPDGDRKVLFEATDIVVNYGRIQALHGVTIRVYEGELVTLLGANGAGKTTTMRALSGLLPLTRGRVVFDGRDITGMKAHDRVKLGIVQAPEGRGVFPGMTVQENLDMGCYARKFATKAEYTQQLDLFFELFPRLRERRSQVGGTLSGGEQQMVAIGRSLMAQPRLLLLDEPSMGLAPMIIAQIFTIIADVNAAGTTILLVEQNAQQALTRTDRAYILETGEVTKEGTGKELLADPAIKAAYLGVG